MRLKPRTVKTPADSRREAEVKKARRLAERSRYYDEARQLAFLISSGNKTSSHFNCVVVTGGGPGIMETANRGACDAGVESIGLNMVLPFEQKPNEYVTPGLCFQFHYFAIRKMHFLMRARALVVFPGGYGTLDELFETLTLIQTKKSDRFRCSFLERPSGNTSSISRRWWKKRRSPRKTSICSHMWRRRKRPGRRSSGHTGRPEHGFFGGVERWFCFIPEIRSLCNP